MIAALIMLAASSASGVDAYRMCVLNAAARYARSSERASDIAEAALGKCLDAEATLRDSFYKEGWTPEQFQSFLAIMQPKMRGLAMSKVLDIRTPNPR